MGGVKSVGDRSGDTGSLRHRDLGQQGTVPPEAVSGRTRGRAVELDSRRCDDGATVVVSFRSE